MIFYADRALIADLPDEHAARVLELLDAPVSRDETPSELQATLEAAQRIPDVSRFLLAEKSRKHSGKA